MSLPDTLTLTMASDSVKYTINYIIVIESKRRITNADIELLSEKIVINGKPWASLSAWT